MVTHSSLSPVILFVYNRVAHTKATVESLKCNPESAFSDLFIFSDGPKSHENAKDVSEVRSYIHQITGFKHVTIIERDTNFGLANSIIDGVTRLCNEYGKVIVLEDDLIVSSHFLSFMNNSLEKYKDAENVMQIAGYMFPAKLDIKEDSLFLPFITSWGWATWARAWEHFDASATNYRRLIGDKHLIKAFNLDNHYDYFNMLKAQQNGQSNSWAIRWYLSVFFLKGLTLYPKHTLVENIGFDGSGENCLVRSIDASRVDNRFQVLKYPKNTEISSNTSIVLCALPKPKLNLKTFLLFTTRKIKALFAS
jgi:hypothetical protein